MRSNPAQYFIFQKVNFFPFHCGAISVYNLLCRLEIHTSIKEIFNLGLNIKPRGMSCDELRYLIQNVNQKYNLDIEEQDCDIDTIDQFLSNGNYGIIFFSQGAKYFAHYAFIEKYTSKRFRIINYSIDTEIKILTRKQLENLIKEKGNFKYPGFWSCSKEIKEQKTPLEHL